MREQSGETRSQASTAAAQDLGLIGPMAAAERRFGRVGVGLLVMLIPAVGVRPRYVDGSWGWRTEGVGKVEEEEEEEEPRRGGNWKLEVCESRKPAIGDMELARKLGPCLLQASSAKNAASRATRSQQQEPPGRKSSSPLQGAWR
ncbi:hypothetical protein K490DRAFT_56167 [Saccharata proteae CBS 121410]|uniref:Uncharacterized protein n=1 Tax=Saccharata proteae CBS 121410 TaxID=1314787 RepID=A0A9P4M0R4_9PEZI|nr:hypothetical protein K490DRAFT_56167 [Saccharata proteae CBS 121410]